MLPARRAVGASFRWTEQQRGFARCNTVFYRLNVRQCLLCTQVLTGLKMPGALSERFAVQVHAVVYVAGGRIGAQYAS
jgi:hypothetical protein